MKAAMMKGVFFSAICAIELGEQTMFDQNVSHVKLSSTKEKEIIEKLVKYFGTTEITKDGGYILKDGRLLDLQRSIPQKKQYHRKIADLLPPELKGTCDDVSISNLLVTTGVLRYEARGRVHVASPPTIEQRRRLYNMMKYSVDEYRVIVTDVNGATIADEMLHSPAAHELKDFFDRSFSIEHRHYLEDEFAVEPDGPDCRLVFRLDHRVIGKYESKSGEFYLLDDFFGAMPVFETLIDKMKLTQARL
ncbi:hypothetical protein ACWU4D_18920 [Vibrio sp. WJH972]